MCGLSAFDSSLRGDCLEKVLFIVNPSSGGEQAVEIAARLIEAFADVAVEVQCYKTTGDDDFKNLTVQAIQSGISKVYVFGGDGTISKYVRAIAGLNNRPEIVLAPLGTTNNLARALNTELNIDRLVSKIHRNQLTERQVDIGQINDDYFVSTLSAGSIPETAWKTDDELKEKLGPFAYIVEGLSALNEHETFDLTVETETGKVFLENLTLLIIGLSNSVFGIPIFFEEAKMDDGKFHLYALKDSDLLRNTASLASDVFRNNVRENENNLSIHTSFSQIRIEASKPMHLAMDGEKGPAFPIDLQILPKHLTFLVPEAEK